MDGDFPVMESGATWTPLNNVRNSLIPGGWWLVAGCAVPAAPVEPGRGLDTGTIPPTYWGMVGANTGDHGTDTAPVLSKHLPSHVPMLCPYCALYLTVWAALLIISYLYSVQLET